MVEKTLGKLQRAVRLRTGGSDASHGYYRVLPDDLSTPDVQALWLTAREDDLRRQVASELIADVRFEHLHKKVEDHVWRLICLAVLDREHDHATDFVAEHAKVPRTVRCLFPVEHLDVMAPMDLGDALLLPLGDERIPVSDFFPLEPPAGGVLAVATTGTNLAFMRDRARLHAHHVLRLLRVGSRDDPQLHERQLWFRLGSRYVFDSGEAGWDLPQGAAFDSPLSQELIVRVRDQELANIPHEPRTDVGSHAKRTLDWLDRALTTEDPLIATLFRFFGLEALLGDVSEGKKARGLTFRRTMLGHIVTGHFTTPELIYFLYDEVRSAAVHGGGAPDVSRDAQVSLEYGIRSALNEYVAFARLEGITKQSRLVQALHHHADALKILKWLRQRNPELWRGFGLSGPGDPD